MIPTIYPVRRAHPLMETFRSAPSGVVKERIPVEDVSRQGGALRAYDRILYSLAPFLCYTSNVPGVPDAPIPLTGMV